MKAKEYFQKYFADLPLTITRGQWFDVCAACFSEFLKEQKEALVNVHNTDSKVSKIREFLRKWQALGDLIIKKYESLPVGRDNPTNDDPVDKFDVKTTKQFFDLWLKSYDEPLHHLVVNVKAAAIYMPKKETPSYLAPMTVGDLKALFNNNSVVK